MQQFDIIMFNMSSYSEWEKGIQNRNYHILHTLQKDPRVRKIVAVDFLPFNFKQMVKRYAQDIVLHSKKGDIIYGDLTSICYQVTSKIYVYSTIDSYFSSNIVAKELTRIEKVLNIKNPIMWSYNPLFTPYFHELHEKMVVFDTVDNWCEHISYTKSCYQTRLGKNYKEIANRADIIFTVSPNLNEMYRNWNRKESVHYIPNGVYLDDFKEEKLQAKVPLPFFEQPEIKSKPVIGYIGTIQSDRFDIDLLEYCAKNHPDKNFVLCGPIWKDSQKDIDQRLTKYTNIYFPGRVSRKEWVNYCMNFDVALNPHKVNAFTKYTCPTKIYEYLACGKPVVSTNVCGADEFNNLIYTANSHQEFSDLIEHALTNETEQLSDERFSHAHKHYSWQSRVEKMLEYITSHSSFKRKI